MNKILLLFILMLISLNLTSNAQSVEKLYKDNCYGCHLMGVNKLAPSKPIIGSPSLKSLDTFCEQIKFGSGMMPAFPNIADNKEQLKQLYDYCLNLKK